MFWIIVAGFLNLALGGFWYGPLFGKIWGREVGLNRERAQAGSQSMTGTYIGAFIGAMIVAYGMRKLAISLDINDIQQYTLVWFGWLAFTLVPAFSSVLWIKRSWKAVIIESLYWLVSLTLIAWLCV